MAHYTDGMSLPFKAASAIPAYRPVTFPPAASAASETVWAASQVTEDVLGMTIATAATAGDPVMVKFTGVAKGIAVGSLGAGCRVGIVGASAPGLGPLTASNIASSANGSGLRYVVGRALKSAAPGDIFPVLLDQGQII